MKIMIFLKELQMEKVQSTLLNQIRVVAKEQPIIAWVSKFSSVTLIVGKYKNSSSTEPKNL